MHAGHLLKELRTQSYRCLWAPGQPLICETRLCFESHLRYLFRTPPRSTSCIRGAANKKYPTCSMRGPQPGDTRLADLGLAARACFAYRRPYVQVDKLKSAAVVLFFTDQRIRTRRRGSPYRTGSPSRAGPPSGRTRRERVQKCRAPSRAGPPSR